VAKRLGEVTSPKQSWSVDASLTKLTVVGCGNVPQG